MPFPIRLTRTLLITAALVAATATAIVLLRHEQPTRIGCPLTDPNRDYNSYTFLHLTFKDFHPAGNQFSGSMTVEVAPKLDKLKPEEIQKWSDSWKKVVLRLDHYENHGLTYQGSSDEPIALAFPPASGSLRGKGDFTWNAIPTHGPFYYPFDSYTLAVNPTLMEVTDPAIYPNLQIDTLETDFGNSNFIPHLHNLNAKFPADPYSITLQRPILLRTLAIVVGSLLILWLMYLIVSAKPGEQAGQVVTLFVGVFSIRSSLLSGAPLFPSLIDYCALGVYLAAALIVLIKWLLPDKHTQDCPFCKSAIPLGATVCPLCTRSLANPKQNSSNA